MKSRRLTKSEEEKLRKHMEKMKNGLELFEEGRPWRIKNEGIINGYIYSPKVTHIFFVWGLLD
jgi:hypothetical protein